MINDIREIKIKIGKTCDLPGSVNACIGIDTAQKEIESYVMLINSNQSPEDQEEAFLHECLHIWREHLSGAREDATKIESETHNRMKEIMSSIAV